MTEQEKTLIIIIIISFLLSITSQNTYPFALIIVVSLFIFGALQFLKQKKMSEMNDIKEQVKILKDRLDALNFIRTGR